MRPEFDRRQIVTGAGAWVLTGLAPRVARTQAPGPALTLRAVPSALALGERTVQGWGFNASGPARMRRGETLTLGLANDLPVPIALNWHGLEGVPELAPLTAVAPLAAGASGQWTVPLRHAGTLLYDLHLLGDAQARPLPAGAIVVQESEPSIAEIDEVLLVEEWRLDAEGQLLAPGKTAPGSAIFTINGRANAAIAVITGQRVRLRLVNGCQRSIVALKIEDHVLTVVAIDGQPAEPFPARDGELILAPGTRIDVIVDANKSPRTTAAILLHDGTAPRPIARLVYGDNSLERRVALGPPQPLPSNNLPARLNLQGALRVALTFDGNRGDWSAPGELTAKSPVAFRVKRGRVVVATLANSAAAPAIFHLHGHHARLLDRLDDGWKPFWLDTITVAAGQTQRIAFLAEYAGSWLMEGMLAQWNATRLGRWFSVEP